MLIRLGSTPREQILQLQYGQKKLLFDEINSSQKRQSTGFC
jgi:hypothetical protein